jgi:predicted phosphodiesterase
MLLALFSDIHGNREAFEACLADARARGAEGYVFLGDLVGYGADPSFVVETVSALARDGAIVIAGNHDVAVVQAGGDMNGYALTAVYWTRETIDEDALNFLESLPYTASRGEVLFVHSDASDPEGWIYILGALDAERSIRASAARIIFSGHVHRPLVASMAIGADGALGPVNAFTPVPEEPITLDPGHKWQVVLGSVGQPRDDNPAAAYALYDDEAHVLTYHRIAYDIERAASKIRAAGLPSMLASRLFAGR